MNPTEHVILEAIEEASVLKVFSAIYEKNSSIDRIKRLRKIYSNTSDPLKTTKIIASRDLGATLSPRGERRLFELVSAFLAKSSIRKPPQDSEKKRLLSGQDFKCAFCGCPIDAHAHADHIVPFKYVGDELADNLQMLCSACNEKKSADLFYQIKHLLGLV